MSSTKYRVSYFTARGRAEPMRQLFVLAGVPYEDRRLEVEEWQKIKPTTPFGGMPLLEVDGKMICQSNAGARYLAKQFGYYGKNDWEAAQIDMVIDCMEDTMKPLFAVMFPKQELNNKEELMKKYTDEQLPVFLENFEKILTSNGNGTYFVGNKLSLADIHFVNFLAYTNDLPVEKEKYPNIFALQSRVENEPKIKEWIAKRPDTQF